jgi:hypothetical protein
MEEHAPYGMQLCIDLDTVYQRCVMQQVKPQNAALIQCLSYKCQPIFAACRYDPLQKPLSYAIIDNPLGTGRLL